MVRMSDGRARSSTAYDGAVPAAGSTAVRVLLVDDASDYRFLLREVIDREEEFEVVGEASDGPAAVEVASALEPDVVLLDVALPGMDGLEALPAIQAAAPEAAVVMLSAFGADRLAAEAVSLGARAYLEKGLRPRELVAGLREVLAGTHHTITGSSA